MEKRTVLLILFFGSCWGAVEAILGGMLYRAEAPGSAAALSILAIFILTVARVYCPMPGSSTLVATCAMMFKVINAPFFVCHFLGILFLGVAYDLVLLVGHRDPLTKRKRIAKNALVGVATTYVAFALFAVLITYVFRYQYWAHQGLPRVLDHVFISGTVAAVGSAFAVPLGARVGEILKERRFAPLELGSRLATGGVSLLMIVLWIVAATVSF